MRGKRLIAFSLFGTLTLYSIKEITKDGQVLPRPRGFVFLSMFHAMLAFIASLGEKAERITGAIAGIVFLGYLVAPKGGGTTLVSALKGISGRV